MQTCAHRCRIIEPSKSEPNFIHAAGIDSPGIAGSPAIALELVELLKDAGLSAAADPEFNPVREATRDVMIAIA